LAWHSVNIIEGMLRDFGKYTYVRSCWQWDEKADSEMRKLTVRCESLRVSKTRLKKYFAVLQSQKYFQHIVSCCCGQRSFWELLKLHSYVCLCVCVCLGQGRINMGLGSNRRSSNWRTDLLTTDPQSHWQCFTKAAPKGQGARFQCKSGLTNDEGGWLPLETHNVCWAWAHFVTFKLLGVKYRDTTLLSLVLSNT